MSESALSEHPSTTSFQSFLIFLNKSLFLTILVPLVLGLLIYAPAVRLPLYLDDAPQFAWLTPLDLPGIWYQWQIASFYRPVPFTVFKLLAILQGGYHAPTLHALLIVLHIANAILVGLLARRLTRSAWIGPIAAALLIAFPFDYQAITWVTSAFHLALVTGSLGAILLALRFLDHGSRSALVGAWIAAFLAIFSHENGVTLPILAGGLLTITLINEKRLRQCWRRLLWIVVPMVGIVALYGVAWLKVPKGSDFGRGIQNLAMDAKIVYVAQALIYPLGAVLRPLVTDNAAIIPTLAVLTGIALALAFGSLWLIGRDRFAMSINMLAAVAWIAVAAVPALLLLNSIYLLGSPRLLYLIGVGVALFWTSWLAGIAKNLPGRLIGTGVIVAFLLVGTVFSLQRIDAHTRMGNFYSAFFADLQTQPTQPAVIVNAPGYIAPPTDKTTFLIGTEGATFFASYLSMQQLIWVNTGIEYPVKAAAFDNTLRQNPWEIFRPADPWLDWQQLDQALGEAHSVYTVSLSATEFHPVRVGDKLITPSATPPMADFGSVILWNARVDSSNMLILEWESRQPTQATPFIHVECDGGLAAQADGPPLGGLHPFDRWTAGERWADRRELGRNCPVTIGLYDPASGKRITAKLSDGSTADEIAVQRTR